VSKLWKAVRENPARAGAFLQIGIAWLATMGLGLSDAQTALLWTAAALVVGEGVRAKVTPTVKL
jgi:hypothetical protein